MSKSSQNVTLTSNEIKRVMGLRLTAEEQATEDAHLAGRGNSNQRKGKD